MGDREGLGKEKGVDVDGVKRYKVNFFDLKTFGKNGEAH